MPSLGPIASPGSGGGLNLSSGGGGGGSVTTTTSTGGSGGLNFNVGGGGGTFTAYVGDGGGGGGSAIGGGTASILQGGSGSPYSAGQYMGGGVGNNPFDAFYDSRLAEIYYLADKPWSENNRFDDPFAIQPSNRSLKPLVIFAAILLLARNL